MDREFKLPELGEGVDEGDVLKVLVSEGDRVEKDQPILEIETDKATLEVPADAAGEVKEIRVDAGDRIRVGQVLAVLSSDDEGDFERAPKQERKEAKHEEPKANQVEAPDKEEEEEEEEEREGEPKEEREPAEEEEEPRKVKAEERPPERRRERRERKKAPPEKKPPGRPPEGRAVPVAAAPSVRRLARELGVDIEQVDGSGPGKRIAAEDVKEQARGIIATTGGAGARPELPDFGRFGATKRERMSGLRRAAARHLSRAWTQIPHVTNHDEADVTETERVRKKYAERVEELGGKLTVTAIAIHIAASALKQFPKFNASIDVVNEEIVYKEFCHVGVAVDTERGLVVPVVRNADRLSLAEIAVALTAIGEKARSGKLAREDMEGSSFTVTNLGGIGGSSFTPIVNWPEVAILGISRARLAPVWQNGGAEPRLVLPLSLSYDHRLIDGADAARFLRFVAEAFEHPLLMSLQGSH